MNEAAHKPLTPMRVEGHELPGVSTITIRILRHAEINHATGELTQAGIAQAEEIGRKLQRQKIDIKGVYTSEDERAFKTTKSILKGANCTGFPIDTLPVLSDSFFNIPTHEEDSERSLVRDYRRALPEAIELMFVDQLRKSTIKTYLDAGNDRNEIGLETTPAPTVAANVAEIILQDEDIWLESIDAGKEGDILMVTHEPILAAVIACFAGREAFDMLGTIDPLDGIELVISQNQDGHKTYELKTRKGTYRISRRHLEKIYAEDRAA